MINLFKNIDYLNIFRNRTSAEDIVNLSSKPTNTTRSPKDEKRTKHCDYR